MPAKTAKFGSPARRATFKAGILFYFAGAICEIPAARSGSGLFSQAKNASQNFISVTEAKTVPKIGRVFKV
jgi:hypothetical protein